MERATTGLRCEVPVGFVVEAYDPALHHTAIPDVYAAAFERPAWPLDWDSFDEFDSAGVFVAYATEAETPAGFAISFQRSDHGYVSVVAVVPEFQRRGVASCLVGSAAEYLLSLGLEKVRIDAWEDSPPAVCTYEHLGFRVYERKMAEDD
jgi:ribosomal protein S18 acetylase RimI-like enzyme